MEQTPPKRRSRKKLIIWAVIIIVIIAGGVAGYIIWRSKQQTSPEGYNQYTSQAAEFEKDPPPSDPLQKAIYYGQIGVAYQEDKQYDKALKNFLVAQEIIDNNNLSNVYVFHQSLADVYAAKGDKRQEKVYIQKQIDYLKRLQQTNPDDGGATVNAIKELEGRLSTL